MQALLVHITKPWEQRQMLQSSLHDVPSVQIALAVNKTGSHERFVGYLKLVFEQLKNLSMIQDSTKYSLPQKSKESGYKYQLASKLQSDILMNNYNTAQRLTLPLTRHPGADGLAITTGAPVAVVLPGGVTLTLWAFIWHPKNCKQQSYLPNQTLFWLM